MPPSYSPSSTPRSAGWCKANTSGRRTNSCRPSPAGSRFATVGISHLTTSRRHLGTPAVRAAEDGAGFRLTGTLPWCTGAGMADLILAGAELPDGRQLLAFVSTDADGVTVADPPDLLALTASATTSVTLDGVRVASERIVSGPVTEVMKQGSGGTGSVGTSALAVGHAAGTLRGLAGEAEKRPDLRETLEPLQRERAALSADVQAIAAAASARRSAGGARCTNGPRPSELALSAERPVVPHRQQGGRLRRRPPRRSLRAGGVVLPGVELPRPGRRRGAARVRLRAVITARGGP